MECSQRTNQATPIQCTYRFGTMLLLIAIATWAAESLGLFVFVGTVSGTMLFATLAVASYTDTRWRRIPNWITYSALGWGILLNLVASLTYVVMSDSAATVSRILGAIGLEASLCGAAACFSVVLVMYVFRVAGAGDVKLAAVVGSQLGLQLGLQVLLYTYIWAGMLVGCYLIIRYAAARIVRIAYCTVGSVAVPLWIASPPENDQRILQQPVPLAAFFSLGTLTVVLMERSL